MAAPKPFVNLYPQSAPPPQPRPGHAGVAKIRMEPDPMPPEPSEEDVVILEPRSTSTATIIDSSELENGELKPKEEPTELPAWAEGFSEEEVQRLTTYTSDDEIKKALLHAQRKIQAQGTEKGGLEAMVKDILAAQQPQQPMAPAQQEPAVPVVDIKKLQEEIGRTWLDTPEENVAKLVSISEKIADAKIQQLMAKQQAAEDARAMKRLLASEPYKGVITKDNAILLDAMASVAPGETMTDKYESALKSYLKEKGPANVTATAAEKAQADQMRQDAQAQAAPVTASVKAKKIYSRAWLQQLMQTAPEKYRQMQPEIMKAYAENRVK